MLAEQFKAKSVIVQSGKHGVVAQNPNFSTWMTEEKRTESSRSVWATCDNLSQTNTQKIQRGMWSKKVSFGRYDRSGRAWGSSRQNDALG
jgi:hypothetical protein